MMMQLRLLVSAYVGLLVYLILIFFFGSTGRFAFSELESYEIVLRANIQKLETLGTALDSSIEALQSDRDRVVLEARKLLYLGGREGVIHVAGYDAHARSVSPGGLLVRKEEKEYKPEPFLRGLAACIAVATFIFLGFFPETTRLVKFFPEPLIGF